MSMRRSLQRYIDASLMLVYSAGAGVVPKGKHRQREANLFTIDMHVDAICEFAWMRRYAESRYVFPIRIRFEGYLRRMDATM